jgi:hypothetical protein
VTAIAVAGLLAALLAIAPSGAAGHSSGGLPDAEIFATNNTAVITDPADPRLATSSTASPARSPG